MNHILPTLLLVLALCTCGRAQNLIGNPVDFDANPDIGWNYTGRASFSSDGTASGTPFWGMRNRIQSGSKGTALLLEGRAMETTRARTNFRSFAGETAVWFGFHQYYRQNEGGNPRLVIRQDGSDPLLTIPLNTLLPPGAETGEWDTVMVDLTSVLAGQSNMSVEFVFSGSSYFWIIDDVGFYDGPPQTRPDTMGNYLREQNYPIAVDSARWAYVPNQLVIQFNGTATPAYQDSLREAFGARLIDSCACDFVELWEIDGTLFQSQGGQQEPATGTTGILSNIIAAKSKTKVDGVDLNTYNLTQPVPINLGPPPTITDFRSFSDEAWSALRIAILDTGIDYNHPSLQDFVRANRTNLPGTASDDLNCLPGDAIGWNFVDKVNNPYDDNGHGTHVAGIIADSLRKYAPNGCNYELLAYKTHDRNGVSTLFDVACATFQASLDDVDIINDSWGFFGDSSVILGNAIDTAATRNILIVSAAGNDAIDLDTLRQFPACYVANNIITVAASDTVINIDGFPDIGRAAFSNFSPRFVDIVAPGVDIVSAEFRGNTTMKSGTSMATPMVTAEAAIVYACLRESLSTDQFSYQAVKDSVLSAARPTFRLNDIANLGRQLAYTESCACDPVATTDPGREVSGFVAYPNPVSSLLSIRSLHPRTAAQISLLDVSGRVVHQIESAPWTQNTPQNLIFPPVPPGIYFLRIRGKDYQWTEKILRF